MFKYIADSVTSSQRTGGGRGYLKLLWPLIIQALLERYIKFLNGLETCGT